MSEDWEYDFSNPPRIPPPKRIAFQCDQCAGAYDVHDVVIKCFLLGRVTTQVYFCSDTCAEQFRMERIRESGL